MAVRIDAQVSCIPVAEVRQDRGQSVAERVMQVAVPIVSIAAASWIALQGNPANVAFLLLGAFCVLSLNVQSQTLSKKECLSKMASTALLAGMAHFFVPEWAIIPSFFLGVRAGSSVMRVVPD
jgi:hypothetical protein